MRKIVNIVPAVGWSAVLSDTEGSGTFLEPLAVWALLEDESGDVEIAGMIHGEGSELMNAGDLENFVGFSSIEHGADVVTRGARQ